VPLIESGQETMPSGAVVELLTRLYQNADLDKDGFVTLDEFLAIDRRMCEQLGATHDPAECQREFGISDGNGDGKIALEEYTQYMGRMLEGLPESNVLTMLEVMVTSTAAQMQLAAAVNDTETTRPPTTLKSDKALYGNVGWWEARYRSDPAKVAFDWYLTYNSLKEALIPHIREADHILVAGAGISRMPAQLYDDGFRNVTSIDISPTAIQTAQEQCKEKKGLQWHHMDVRMLDFPSESFDVVIDKALTDAILTGDGSFHNVTMSTKEIWRVLQCGGRYICISHGAPNKRLHHFQRHDLGWTVEHTAVAKNPLDAAYDLPPSACYHIYTCTKFTPTEVAIVDDFDDDDDFA